MQLIIGNKRYSSWSLRPWLILRHFGIPFEETLIPLDLPETEAAILRYSPSGKVPALLHEGQVIWESLAIAEYLHEKFPEKNMWPSDARARAHARSVANEMHGGFQAMREHLSHDLQKELTAYDHGPAREDLARVQAIWTDCLERSGGPFLFGNFSIADAMYAPVVNRFVSYAVPRNPLVQKYVDAIRQLPAHQEWIRAARAETFVAAHH